MHPETKEWIKLGALVFMAGSGVTISTFLGGAKLWIAILAGLGAAGSSVYHALDDKPADKAQTKNSQNS